MKKILRGHENLKWNVKTYHYGRWCDDVITLLKECSSTSFLDKQNRLYCQVA